MTRQRGLAARLLLWQPELVSPAPAAPSGEPSRPAEASPLAAEFDAFWSEYPRRQAKKDAFKAYAQAREEASAEVILEGVRAYKRHMPEEERFRPLPASWLRAGRWEDEYETSRRAPDGRIDWFEQCKQVHGGECGLDRYRHITRMQMEQLR